MKDGLGRAAVTRLGANIARAWPEFDQAGFVRASMRGLSGRELKERVVHVADQLARQLPDDYGETLAIVLRAAETWDRGHEDDPLRAFAAWPVFQLIETHGLQAFDDSLAALAKITHLFSAEFAVRPYIATDPKRAFRILSRWTGDGSEHVRRLASEGCRPRLPWATRLPGLIEEPAPVLKLLERLRDDDSPYVRRSVANNLNDISRDHPELVVALCERWQKSATPERRWIIERATRTLVKQGHPGVWGLLGFTKQVKVAVSKLRVEPAIVRMGEGVSFEFALTSRAKSSQTLVVDYAMHYTKANGKTRAKVFKLSVIELTAGETVKLKAARSFRAISTRQYYPGAHHIEILVQGQPRGQVGFELVDGDG